MLRVPTYSEQRGQNLQSYLGDKPKTFSQSCRRVFINNPSIMYVLFYVYCLIFICNNVLNLTIVENSVSSLKSTKTSGGSLNLTPTRSLAPGPRKWAPGPYTARLASVALQFNFFHLAQALLNQWGTHTIPCPRAPSSKVTPLLTLHNEKLFLFYTHLKRPRSQLSNDP